MQQSVRAVTILAGILIGGCAAMDKHSVSPTPVPSNPLLAPWPGPFGGVPPWDSGTPERYREALAFGLDERKKNLDAVANDPAAPTFANTIVPMQKAGRTLTRVAVMFSVMTGNMRSPEYQALNREIAPKLAAAQDAIFFDERLFKRIEGVYATRDKLTPEQRRLVERTRDAYVRSGAQLSLADKQKLSEINQQLATLFAQFSDKVLADENTWTVLETQTDLAGLSESLIASAAAAADERGLKGKWLIINTRSSVDPFLTFSTRRDLREKVWRRFVNRGDNGDANDTNDSIKKIVKARADRAKLLGFASHAHWRMSDTMAKDPVKAQELMMRVWPAAVGRAHEEVAAMQKVAASDR